MQWRAMPVFMVFLTMGFMDAVGPMAGLAKETFQLSHFTAQLLPSSGLLMFGVLSIPVAIFQDRAGKKPVLILGLCIALFGLSCARCRDCLPCRGRQVLQNPR